jgi:hypothetical protein
MSTRNKISTLSETDWGASRCKNWTKVSGRGVFFTEPANAKQAKGQQINDAGNVSFEIKSMNAKDTQEEPK